MRASGHCSIRLSFCHTDSTSKDGSLTCGKVSRAKSVGSLSESLSLCDRIPLALDLHFSFFSFHFSFFTPHSPHPTARIPNTQYRNSELGTRYSELGTFAPPPNSANSAQFPITNY